MFGHIARMPDETDAKQILTASPQETGGDHWDVLVLHGWKPFSRIWNPATSIWTTQLTWLKTVHSGDWCLRSALRTFSGACQKWWWWSVEYLKLFQYYLLLILVTCNNIVDLAWKASDDYGLPHQPADARNLKLGDNGGGQEPEHREQWLFCVRAKCQPYFRCCVHQKHVAGYKGRAFGRGAKGDKTL